MNKDPSTLANIVIAFSDPFTLLALVLAVLGIVFYQSTKQTEASYKGIPLSFFSVVTIAVAVIAFGLNVGRLLRSDKPPVVVEAPKKTSTLQVTFYGTRSRTEAVTVPFRVSSGQINVGCGDVGRTQAVYTAPPNARNINAVPSWENIRDVRQQDKSLNVQGTVVTAVGQLVGNNREWTGNCPAGGHGELVITGSYVIDRSSTPEQVVLSTFQGFVQPNTSNPIPLPQVQPLPASITGQVVVSTAGGVTSTVNLDISIDAAGNATGVVQPQPAASGTGPALVAARVEGKNLAIDVR